MEIILIITGLIQLVIIIIVVYSIININNQLKQLSEKQNESFKKRNQAYSLILKGLNQEAKTLMLEALAFDVLFAMEFESEPLKKIKKLKFNYNWYWKKCFKEKSKMEIEIKCEELIKKFNI